MKPLLLISCLLPLVSLAQKNKHKEDQYYLFDTAWKPAKEKSAVYIARVQHIDDTTWQWNYYHRDRGLISIESFRDEKAEIPNGYCAWYDNNGQIDSCGYSINGKKHGDWHIYNDKLAVTWISQYDNGRYIRSGTSKDLYPKTPSSPGDTDAVFQGGMEEWKKYLGKNYRFPTRSLKNKISGTVQVGFAIDTTGQVTQLRVLKSVEVTIDTEVLRLIGASPKWIPAVKDGRKVMAYRKQPFSSLITGN